MREITSHKVNGCNEAIQIEVMDAPGSGGASHEYLLTTLPPQATGCRSFSISFQNGPIKEVGTNGVTQEALLAIVVDRLECFQRGPYACEDNATALAHVKAAMFTLQNRTRARVARGVEGTHEK